MINNQLYKSKYLTIFKRLGSHSVLALIALIVIGGATRVMEAGLACPDWPLCYGSFLPSSHMNLRVFLECFHRLDAFFVAVAISFQFLLALIYKTYLPKWLPWISAFFVLLVTFQAILGALTVSQLLPASVVTAHLGLALTLVAGMSGLAQVLLSPNTCCFNEWLGSEITFT